MRTLPAIPALLLLLAAAPSTRPTASVSDRVGQVAERFRFDPATGGYSDLFAPSFLDAVPPEKVTGLFRSMFTHAGRCVGVVPEGAITPTAGKFRFTFEKGLSAVVTASVEADAPHRLDGLWIGPFEPTAHDFPALIDQLRHLPGTTSLYAAALADDGTLTPVASYNDDKPLAIGSAFKLYVLAELARQINAGLRHWDDVCRLDPARRSLPSGVLQGWPAGSAITVQTLATLMISQSDNTAADELLLSLGRSNVEAVLPLAGHAEPQLDQPFLTTGELFRIKGTPSLATQFASADPAARRALLAGPVAAIPIEDVKPYATPRHVGDVEWLATTADLCRAMAYLRDQSTDPRHAAPARSILSVNPGLPVDKTDWPYVGYKGGSEPGVLNLTFLLRSHSGRWFVTSVGWNNPDVNLNENQLIGGASTAIALLGKP